MRINVAIVLYYIIFTKNIFKRKPYLTFLSWNLFYFYKRFLRGLLIFKLYVHTYDFVQ